MARARVLLVEDDPMYHLIVKKMLADRGFELAGIAETGEQALRALQDSSPDIVLMDIGLEGDLDGIDVVTRFQKDHDIPVVYLTGHTEAEVLRRARATGPYGFLPKPVRKDSLEAAIETALARHDLDRTTRVDRSWFATVLGGIGEAVVAAAADGRVTYVNPAAEQILERKRSACIGAQLDEIAVFLDSDGKRTEVSAVGDTPPGECPERSFRRLTLVGRSGEDSEVEASVSCLRDDGGRVVGLVLLLRDVSARVEAERALEKTRARYQALFEQSKDAIVLTAADGAFIDVNAEACDLLGYSAGQLIEGGWRAIVSDSEAMEVYQQELGKKSSARDHDLQLRRRNGQIRDCLFTSHARRSVGGEVTEFQHIIRDVTARKELLETLRSFKLAVDSTQIGVTITDMEGTIIYANPAEAEMHGYDAEDLVGMKSAVLGLEPAPGQQLQQPDPELSVRWKRQRVNRRSDGSRFPAQLFSDVVRDVRGDPVAVVTCCEDISDQLQGDEQIRKLYRAVEQSPALVIITDINGDIEYVNPQFTETTGFAVDEVLGENPRVLKSGQLPEDVYRDLWTTISNGKTWRGEFLNRKKDGSTYWAMASISGLQDDRGDVRHYIGIQEDISRRKEMEHQLEEKNKELERLDRLKSDMVAVTSHDLKSPLNAMVSLATLLRDTSGVLPQAKTLKYVDQIIASGRKLTSFITDILDAEKIESGRVTLDLAHTTLAELVGECAEVCRAEARGKAINVELLIGADVSPVVVDQSRMERVFNNLLSNAVKFSPPESTITVQLEASEGGGVVSICDQGPGIPEGDIDHIFDRYYQVQRKGEAAERGFGVGLGLYISRELVVLHGGTIEAENRQGGGCCFRVALPAAPSPESEADLVALVIGEGLELPAKIAHLMARKGVTVLEPAAEETAAVIAAQRPHVLVVGRLEGTGAVMRALESVHQPLRPVVVNIDDQAGGDAHPMVDRSLMLPLADSEVFEVLRDIVLQYRSMA